MKLWLKVVVFALAAPGTVAGLVPYLILSRLGAIRWPDMDVATLFAGAVALVCMAGLAHCMWGFAYYGGGTPAPIEPPTRLVVHGLYRYTRNPMYLAVLGLLLSEAVMFRSGDLFLYAGFVFCAFYLFVRFYEEPRLLRQFGTAYAEYRRNIPRWGFALRTAQDSGRNSK